MTAIQGGIPIAIGRASFASASISSFANSMLMGGVHITKGNEPYTMTMRTLKGIGGNFSRTTTGALAFGAVSGGAGARLAGGNFWQGAVTGLIVTGFNHLMHSVIDGDGDGGGDPKKKTQNNPVSKKDSNETIILDDVKKFVEFFYDNVMGKLDFIETYIEMREANWVNSDKYFHSKANFKASLRGPGGKQAAIEMSLLRELADYYLKGDLGKHCIQDMKANVYGIQQAQKLSYFKYYNLMYKDVLTKYRPIKLSNNY